MVRSVQGQEREQRQDRKQTGKRSWRCGWEGMVSHLGHVGGVPPE